MAEDHYAVLGISRTSTPKEIQSAYRKLARKYHPDLNPDDPAAKERFQQVQQAFEVLNDPQKRELYDRYGSAYDPTGGVGHGSRRGRPNASRAGQGVEIDLEELMRGAGGGGAGVFADLFKQFSARGRQGGGRPEPEENNDVQMEIVVPFATAVLGGERQISLPTSDGHHETIQVKIPAGVEDGKKIRLRGQGRPATRGGKRGDAMLIVRIAPHPHFNRSGLRLDVQVPVTLAEAIQGARIDLPTPHGVITLTIPPGTSSGKKLRVKGHGIRPTSGPAGDLFAEIQVVLPEGLTDEQRQAIVKLLPIGDRHPRDTLRW